MNSTLNLSSGAIKKAKAVPIVSLLFSQGYEPIKQSGGELIYLSPLRNENTASFFVNPSRNCFKDFGIEEHKGDAITLSMLLWQVDFKTAVERLLSFDGVSAPSFSFSGVIGQEQTKEGIEVVSVKPLTSPALRQYVSKRGISLKLAERYLQEVTYCTKGRQFYAVGFKNDSGGYELRNGLGFKGGKTRNGISTFEQGTESVALFEGFFDFLSAMQYYGREVPIYTAIVLNTCNNIKLALPLLANRKVIHCFLDNDKTGRTTLQTLINAGFCVKDWSAVLYPSCNDFNDFLTSSHKEAVS